MSMRLYLRLLLGAVVVAHTHAADPIYRQHDEEGRPVFTDQPGVDAEPVELPPANITPEVEPAPRDAETERDDFAGYRTVQISEPGNIVPNGLANTTVAVRLEPALREGHRLRVLLDGEAIASGSQSRVSVGQLPRGSHSLEVQVLAGPRIVATARTEIFVYWPGGNR